ncbi:hypothetical protein [Meiothermus taiwanensis]|uniref:Uncharacterized protein n=1 Tax=Meiothermus taiwanensis TaxID=172827 RepID=A0A399E872_9DEIN|nr:hypothetical protein [Meiothermus taiwanensis]KIQ55477.1 hypothetical protein SY28_03090 [Meiothermus taiwanensis]KZK16797.1 hypothetical protein A3962_04765 [Meiothermus taiwanensis]MCX7802598.1 hypothetical protein [Meiothermus ruber]RIH78222.1 hypothetical protein Mcate_00964 [Meiothermus taiwanensis]
MIFSLEQAPAQPLGEVTDLQQLLREGLSVVPTLVLLGVETEFYQLANLAEQIRRAFEGVFGARLDEDKLERACAFAERLLRESYLLPERAEEIRAALPEGPVLVRYAGEAPFGLETGKQETLWALKRLWASRWQVDAVLLRGPHLAPPEAASLVQVAGDELVLDESLSAQASQILGRSVKVWASQGRVVRVV